MDDSSPSSTGSETSDLSSDTVPAACLPDVYVKCPYFPEHELRRSRLPYHLLKCQKNPLAPQLLACPYNYLHRVRSEERAEHLALCEDRPLTKYHDRESPSCSNLIKALDVKAKAQIIPEESNNFQDDGEEFW